MIVLSGSSCTTRITAGDLLLPLQYHPSEDLIYKSPIRVLYEPGLPLREGSFRN